jgi:hypothetical protein
VVLGVVSVVAGGDGWWVVVDGWVMVGSVAGGWVVAGSSWWWWVMLGGWLWGLVVVCG